MDIDLMFPAMPVGAALPEALISFEEWEGYVVDVGDTDFVARLLNITRGDKCHTEQLVVPIDQLSQEDAANLRPGRVFRLVFGDAVSPPGARQAVQRIVFRDLPRLTDEDWERGRQWADQILEAFAT